MAAAAAGPCAATAATSNVIVGVRVRPMNKRELKLSSKPVVTMKGNQTILKGATSKRSDIVPARDFAFDYSFWSTHPGDEHFADQAHVFERLGLGCLDNAFEGYNACIFAYGQTGSGKSYTMMGGPDEDKGIIPRLCETAFSRIAELSSQTVSYKMEVSYMEIYNEKVRDLLGDVRNQKKSLRVREHRIMGPYVEGLTKLAVQDYATIKRLMDEGNQSRTVASTNMNAESSRSHAVFTIVMTQHRYDPVTEHIGEKVSKISLVDLAGSERAGKTGASGHHLREGSNINKSLTTLGQVISALAELSKRGGKKHGKDFVPYRNSQLTWLLKENLGGNSKTVMVATISPAADNYEETLSTLRYADRAKQIVNHAVINEDPNERIIRELREEVEKLKLSLGVTTEVKNAADVAKLREALNENESLMAELNMTWEEKLETANKLLEERERALSEMGIHVAGSAIAVDITKSYLVNINADPSLNEMLVYYLKDEKTLIGTKEAGAQQDIVLSGVGIAKEHAVIEAVDGMLYVDPVLPAQTFVNGAPCTKRTLLAHGFRLALGPNHLFRVCTTHKVEGGGEEPQMSWADAQKELALKLDADFEKEKQAALEEQAALFDAKLQAMKEQGVLLDAEAKDRARREAEAEAARLERERERAREDVSKVSQLVREANALAEELHVPIRYKIKMRLSLFALCNPGSETAAAREIAITILDQTAGTSRVILLDPFMAQLNYLRDVYDGMKDGSVTKASVPAHFAPAGMELIGVAHVFLAGLRHGITLDLSPAVVNPDGAVTGEVKIKLAIEPKNHVSADDGEMDSPIEIGDVLRFRVVIVEARGIPYTLSTHVNARFTFFGHDEVLVPEKLASPDLPVAGADAGARGRSGVTKEFDQSWDKLLETEVTEELMAYMRSKTMAVQLWGHNINVTLDHPASRTSALRRENFKRSTTSPALSRKAASMLGITVTHKDERRAIHSKFSERWHPHCRQLNMWVQILELNEEGQHAPVGVSQFKGVTAGSVAQIRQGFAKSLSIQISQPDPERLLPIARISAVRIGEMALVEATEAQMDSSTFGETDISSIRDQFSAVINEKQIALEEAIRKTDKSREDERGRMFKEWSSLVAERDALLSPEIDSGLPGADTTADIPVGYESSLTTVFAGSIDVMSPVKRKVPQSMLPLHIVKQTVDEWPGEVTCQVSWDIAAHNSPNLNKITDSRYFVYLHLQVECQLANATSFVLNKLIVCQVHKRSHKFRDTARRSFFFSSSTPSLPRGTGAIYRVFTSIPTFEADDAPGAEEQTESASKRYSEIASSLTNLVQIDRLKQDMLMRNVKLTKPTALTSLKKARSAYLCRPRSVSELAPATAIELELESKLRMAKSLGNDHEAYRISTQLDQMKAMKLPENEADEWVVIESEMKQDSDGLGQSLTVRRPTSSTPLPPPEEDDDEDKDSKSMSAIFRQKVKSASSMKELKKLGQFISLTKNQGTLSPDDLETLRNTYERRSAYLQRLESPPGQPGPADSDSSGFVPVSPSDALDGMSDLSPPQPVDGLATVSPAVRVLKSPAQARGAEDAAIEVAAVKAEEAAALETDGVKAEEEVAAEAALAKAEEEAAAEAARVKAEEEAAAEAVLAEAEEEAAAEAARVKAEEEAAAEAARVKAEEEAAAEAARVKAEEEVTEARLKAEEEVIEARVKAEEEAAAEAARVKAEEEAAAEAARVKAEEEAA
eukprot:CAMPEP_0206302004 /NCGR_PEP_ID=MMETSP0106_2-20121207/8501_1 /ASSEMBLY_ACC=CAM_ASM_000206 /TAXON_ID=81532 /ORGANISM="Acanthoeca-like sp., Strain 10tr" /LENGTH=1711 /DNA_ID=CAMNT_0053732761 /DNA_START=15 /DNA_END=5147 /DNA_ORIENTATION=-